jgi:hypothetical protein
MNYEIASSQRKSPHQTCAILLSKRRRESSTVLGGRLGAAKSAIIELARRGLRRRQSARRAPRAARAAAHFQTMKLGEFRGGGAANVSNNWRYQVAR